MSRISIPGDELAEVINLLSEIRDRIERTASLGSVGTEEDVGDSRLQDAVADFDDAWKAGQQRVRENADTFRETVEGILQNFEKTDTETGRQLD